MLSSVLRSRKAIQINITIIRTFVKIRQILSFNRDLARKVQDHDRQIATLFDTVEKLLALPAPPKKNPIGYIKPVTTEPGILKDFRENMADYTLTALKAAAKLSSPALQQRIPLA